MKLFDELVSELDDDFQQVLLNNYIMNCLNQDNWKLIHSAIMIMSQIIEYFVLNNIKNGEQNNNLDMIFKQICLYNQHQNPRIRYACLHALG